MNRDFIATTKVVVLDYPQISIFGHAKMATNCPSWVVEYLVLHIGGNRRNLMLAPVDLISSA